MTTLAGHAATAPVARRLAELAAELAELQQQLAPPPRVASAADSALERLLCGSATSQDHAAVGVTLKGARVVVCLCPTARDASHLRGRLAEHARVQLTPSDALEVRVVVAEYPRTAGQCGALERARRVAAAAIRTPGAVVGISSPVEEASQLAAAYGEAVAAAGLARELPEAWVVAEEHWAALAVRRLGQHVAASLTLRNPLSLLKAYDDQHGGDLMASVRTWLSCNGDTPRTATALAVHPNTLRYRLRRASQVAGLDLSDPDARALTILMTGGIPSSA